MIDSKEQNLLNEDLPIIFPNNPCESCSQKPFCELASKHKLCYCAKHYLNLVLSELPPRQQEIIGLRFGLNGNKQLSINEIAEKYNVTRETIRMIIAKALHESIRVVRRNRLEKRMSVLSADGNSNLCKLWCSIMCVFCTDELEIKRINNYPVLLLIKNFDIHKAIEYGKTNQDIFKELYSYIDNFNFTNKEKEYLKTLNCNILLDFMQLCFDDEFVTDRKAKVDIKNVIGIFDKLLELGYKYNKLN